jgi:hypothetical protein
MFVSLDPILAQEWDDHHWRNHAVPLNIELERRTIPVLPAEVVMWEGSDGDSVTLYPHLHYTCPRCQKMQNVDLYDTDTNPRLACCSICRWDSLVWLAWDSSTATHPQRPNHSLEDNPG